MTRSAAFHGLAIASALAAFLVMPSLAEDMDSGVAGDPVYVWQGNHINNPDIPQAPSRSMPPSMQGMPASGAGSVTSHMSANMEASPSAAAATESSSSSEMPQAVQVGAASYITGGIGIEERDALDAVKAQYNVHITSAATSGEFDGDTRITIRDGKGAELFNADAGPLFFAQLPPGTYTLEAVSGGRTQQKKLNVAHEKALTIVLRW